MVQEIFSVTFFFILGKGYVKISSVIYNCSFFELEECAVEVKGNCFIVVFIEPSCMYVIIFRSFINCLCVF